MKSRGVSGTWLSMLLKDKVMSRKPRVAVVHRQELAALSRFWKSLVGAWEQRPSFLLSLRIGKLWFKIMSEQNSFVRWCHLTQIVCFYGLSQLVKVTLTIIGTCDIPQYYCISHSGTVSGLRLSPGSVPSLCWSLYDLWLSYETITLESLRV